MQRGIDSNEWTRVEPEHWRFGGGAADSVLHPLVLVGALVTMVCLLSQRRRTALYAFLFSTFLIPAGQQMLLGGVHVFVYRMIVVVGWARVLSAPRLPGGGLFSRNGRRLDRIFLLYVILHVIAFLLLNPDMGAVTNQIGFIWDYIGGYFVLRHLIQDEQDVTSMSKCFALLAAILAICMVGEQMTGQNIFGALGGVRAISQVREGRIRSEAVFQHAILAGSFGATLLPMMFWLWKEGRAKFSGVIGLAGCTVMVLTSACSTPLAAYAAGWVSLAFWPMRRYMRTFRWALGIGLLALHFTMNAPVWALIQRIDVVQGSSSYHRYQLVDQFLRHWSEWWLIGTKSNGSWGDLLFDVSNQYVAEGIAAGLFPLALFIGQIVWSFGKLGTARKIADRRDRAKEWLLWALGATMIAHMTAFLGISYFDQTRVAWFALLAAVCAVTATPKARTEIAPAVEVAEDAMAASGWRRTAQQAW